MHYYGYYVYIYEGYWQPLHLFTYNFGGVVNVVIMKVIRKYFSTFLSFEEFV